MSLLDLLVWSPSIPIVIWALWTLWCAVLLVLVTPLLWLMTTEGHRRRDA